MEDEEAVLRRASVDLDVYEPPDQERRVGPEGTRDPDDHADRAGLLVQRGLDSVEGYPRPSGLVDTASASSPDADSSSLDPDSGHSGLLFAGSIKRLSFSSSL